MLRLNLVLNNLTTSIHNIIQGNTILKPYHRERDETIKKFKEDKTANVLLISLKVGGVGLNLNFANNVILYNP